jgi:uncharacterized protein YcfL
MNYHRCFIGSLAASALLAFTGCSSTSINSVERASPTGVRQMVSDKRVLTDASLSRHLGIVGVNEEVTAGGLMRVQVELQNRTRSFRRFNYRFEWFNENGIQVNSPQSSYLPRQVEGGESIFISGVAPAPNAKDFRLKLIEPMQ